MSQHLAPGGALGTGQDGGDRSHLLSRLDERLRFEGLLARLSATFIHLPAEEVDGQIERGLQQIVEFLDIDRSSLGQFSEDGGEFWVTHSHSAPGVAPMPRVNLAAAFPWYTAMIRRGEVLRFNRLPDELPPEAVREREYCLQNGLRSQLIVPFQVGGAVLGGIGFNSFGRPRDWPDELVQSLQLVGQVFANALARKRAEEARRRGDARLRHLLESTHAVPWVADAASWRFTYVGRQAGQLLGYPPGAWYKPGFWTAHIHPDDREEAIAFCLEHSRRVSDYEFEYRMLAADGRTVWIHDIVHVVAEDGAPRTLQGFMIDVTARRRAEEESRSLREQLARAGRATLLGELAASIAHEVNQPLCAVVSNAQAVQRMLAGERFDLEEVRAALRDITRDGQRASAVIARIRGSLQKGPAERAPVDVNELVREVAALARAEMARRGVTVRLELAEGLPPVPGDRIQLQQVVLNLMANGAEAMERVARVVRELVIRSAGTDAAGVTVAVTDAGAGINPAAANRLFDTFFTTKPGGMGMGLAICKSIVEAHGGRIGAAPAAGGGTTVQFTLPGTPEGTS